MFEFIMVERLTVLTTIDLQSQSNPPSRVPVQWNEAEVAGNDRLFEFVLHHSVCVTVPRESLKK